ncbi:MAG: methyltransferase domain-containing protein [Gammaproteobacteria bacterium]|nr:methyltransferase domain-containing protein [Gammaproteobacteria bacterium]
MRVLCLEIPEDALSAEEYHYLYNNAAGHLNIAQVWRLMDDEWERCGAGYDKDQLSAVRKFYDSPIWLLNGIFTECDTESVRHRDSIANWVAEQNPNLVVDFGGGYGALARKIAHICPYAKVVIIEPHPTDLARRLARDYTNLSFSSELPKNSDIIIAQDVLEHLADPLAVCSSLIQATREGGYLITANCFYPVIKCHLPSTFHFRYSFSLIIPYLGCTYIGVVPEVNHAQIFKKASVRAVKYYRVKTLEYISRAVFPAFDFGVSIIKPIWRLVHKHYRA